MHDINTIIQFAHHLADVASDITKKYYRLPNGEVAKLDNSPVTLADQQIELSWRQLIKKNFPSHGIIGEEYDDYQANADNIWIIDPIDGTSSFISGKPIFGNLIAFVKSGSPIFGMINQPITNERWFASDVAYFNQQKITTRNCLNIADATLCSTSPYFFFDNDRLVLDKLTKCTKYQRIGGITYGGDCYNYACLAMGFIDIVIEPGLKICDFAAIIPIITAAGGVVSDWQGNPLKLQANAKLLACANKQLHQQVLSIIN
jgi:inositol-phosphate phosphatase/L-galactose 1-phosphate phosphatase/histidinol-phosphatase